MGSKSSKQSKTLEPAYNSFDMLPNNDYYNRQVLQQQQQQQQFQQFGQSTLNHHLQHQAQPLAGMFYGFQQQQQPPVRLSLPQHQYGPAIPQTPLHNHHHHQFGPRLQMGYLGQSSNQSLSLGRHSDNLSRRNLSIYPSATASNSPQHQIIQSVPKFNQQQGPIVKF
jgi:D-alanyl-D-alanine dipeptidase